MIWYSPGKNLCTLVKMLTTLNGFIQQYNRPIMRHARGVHPGTPTAIYEVLLTTSLRQRRVGRKEEIMLSPLWCEGLFKVG